MSTISTLNNGESGSVIRGKINTNFTNLNNDKVEKETGKGLSTNDYTTAEKNKLAGIEAGAEVNNISDVNATDLTDGGVTTLHSHPGGSGSGDVEGPASATDGNVALFDGITGKLIKDGGTVASNVLVSPTDELIPQYDAGSKKLVFTTGFGLDSFDNHLYTPAGIESAGTLSTKGTLTGKNIIATANTSATDYTNTLPAKSGTIAMTSDITGYLYGGATATHTYTDNGNGTINVPAIDVYLFNNATFQGIPNKYTLPAINNLLLTDQTQNYIVGDYNGGTPIQKVITDVSLITESNVIPLLSIYRSGTILHEQNWDALGVGLANKVHQSIVKTQRYRRESGLAIGEAGTRNITLTAGVVWTGAVPISLDAINTATDNLFFNSHTSGNWTTSVVTQYNNTQWDNGTDLKGLALEGPNASTWTRTGTLATGTFNGHNLSVGDIINVTVTSSAGPLPLGNKTILSITDNTFTFQTGGGGGGATSGTFTYTTELRYAVNWIFRGVESQKHLYYVLGTGNYTLSQAQSATVPNIPTLISSHAVLVGKITVARNGTTATSIQSAFDTTFSFSTVTSHPNLLNLLWSASGHNGTPTTIAGFADTTGVAQEITVGSGLSLSGNTLATTGLVPTSRTLTINGTAYDLSADRSWIVGTRVVTTTDDSTAVIDVTLTDTYELSAIANATTFSTTGTPIDGQKLIIRFKDAGVAKGLTWDAIFVAIGVTLPTTTVAGKRHYVGCQYNSAASKFHVIAVGQES